MTVEDSQETEFTKNISAMKEDCIYYCNKHLGNTYWLKLITNLEISTFPNLSAGIGGGGVKFSPTKLEDADLSPALVRFSYPRHGCM